MSSRFDPPHDATVLGPTHCSVVERSDPVCPPACARSDRPDFVRTTLPILLKFSNRAGPTPTTFPSAPAQLVRTAKSAQFKGHDLPGSTTLPSTAVPFHPIRCAESTPFTNPGVNGPDITGPNTASPAVPSTGATSSSVFLLFEVSGRDPRKKFRVERHMLGSLDPS